jgi:hypothetical protein
MKFRPIWKKVSILLFGTFLSLAVTSYALAGFTNYGTEKSTFVDVISGDFSERFFGNGDTEELRDALLFQCKSKSSVDLPVQSQTITLKCSEIKSNPNILAVMANALFDKVYYKKYDCNFFSCVSEELSKGVSAETVFLFVGQKAHEFYNWLLAAAAVLTITFVFVMRKFEQTLAIRLKLLGWPFLLTGISYLYVFFRGQAGGLSKFTDPLFDLLSPIYLVFLIAGIGLLIAGYYLSWKKPVSKSAE